MAVAIIANPSLLNGIGLPVQYTSMVVGVILIVYNGYYPRNPVAPVTPVEPLDEDSA